MNKKTIPIISQTITRGLTKNDVPDEYQWVFNSKNLNFNKNLNLSGVYCHHPFNTITVDSRGDVFLCTCQAWLPVSVGKIFDFDSLEEILDSDVAVEIQKSIIDGSYRYCDNNSCSLLMSNELTTDLINIEPEIHWLNLSIDDSCNLTCASCRKDFRYVSDGEIFEYRKRIASHLISLIEKYTKQLKITLSSDGDPFASLIYRSFLSDLNLKENNNVEIEIITNGIMAGEQWHKFEKIYDSIVNIKISFDAASEQTYTRVRSGGNWNKLLKSLKIINQWRNDRNSNATITANFVVQKKNYKEIIDYIKLCLDNNVDYVNLQKLENWGTFDDFNSQAVWLEDHPEFGQLLDIFKHPLLKHKRVNVTNLSFLNDYLEMMHPTMKLSELVTLKNKLSAVDVGVVSEHLDNLDGHFSNLLDTPLQSDFQNQINSIIKSIDTIEQELSFIQTQIPSIVEKINFDLIELTEKYLKRGYTVNGILGSNKTTPETERKERISALSKDSFDKVLTKIRGYTSWQYPALEIGPGDGVWTEYMVAADPLYLIDIEQEYLNNTLNRFNSIYRNKLRPYLTGVTVGKSDFDYSALPYNQFNFIFSWNVFDYFPYYETKLALRSCYELLRPGGTMMFSFNNCDTTNGATYAENGFKSWLTPALIAEICNELGFIISSFNQPEITVNWVEIKKPGQLRTVKGHPAMGKIITNPT